jgi:hypothetical protein
MDLYALGTSIMQLMARDRVPSRSGYRPSGERLKLPLRLIKAIQGLRSSLAVKGDLQRVQLKQL